MNQPDFRVQGQQPVGYVPYQPPAWLQPPGQHAPTQPVLFVCQPPASGYVRPYTEADARITERLYHAIPSRVITRPPFPHGKHIVRSLVTLGLWLPVYGVAYVWHRFGPTKAVSTWS